ncbi:MAG: hypothetical protein ACI8YQ_004422 [Polaribacter sp.]|jgi:hypothetical protein
MLSAAYSVLDSKIQYIEYQAQCNLDDCVCGRSTRPGSAADKATSLTQNFEWMLQQINTRNNELKQLQTMKYWLREENLNKVRELLHDDNYLEYSEKSLEKLLKKGALELMRMKYM